MNVTHVFKLPSGVECEVKEFNGKHQDLLTRQGSNLNDQMNIILADIIVRYGSIAGSGINTDIVEQMLTADRNWVMFQARQFSLDFPTTFDLPVKYKKNGIKVEDKISMNLSDVTFKPYPFQVSEHSEITKDYMLSVKRYEGKIRVSLSDGVSEKRIAEMNKKDISSHIDLLSHNPVYFSKENPIKLDLSNLGLMAIEDLRSQIMGLEGKVYADFEEEHPDDSRIGEDRIIRGNLLGNVNFFFPSGAFS